jgi:hypothetical protein
VELRRERVYSSVMLAWSRIAAVFAPIPVLSCGDAGRFSPRHRDLPRGSLSSEVPTPCRDLPSAGSLRLWPSPPLCENPFPFGHVSGLLPDSEVVTAEVLVYLGKTGLHLVVVSYLGAYRLPAQEPGRLQAVQSCDKGEVAVEDDRGELPHLAHALGQRRGIVAVLPDSPFRYVNGGKGDFACAREIRGPERGRTDQDCPRT